MAKNPLASSGSSGAKGRDMVKDPAGAGKGTDFVLKPEGKQGGCRGRDFVADQDRVQPSSSPSQRANPASVPEGGSNTAEALQSQNAPGNGGSAGPQGKKPFRLH